MQVSFAKSPSRHEVKIIVADEIAEMIEDQKQTFIEAYDMYADEDTYMNADITMISKIIVITN